MVRLAIVAVCFILFSVSSPLRAENSADILDPITGAPGIAPRPSSPDAKDAEKKTSSSEPRSSGLVDEPGFKASVKFGARPSPNFDLSSTNTNQISTPKSKAWAVPLEEGYSGPPRTETSPTSPDAAAAESNQSATESISPTLASAIARDKGGAKASEMILIYRAIVKSEPDNAAPHYRLGLALIHGGELQNGLVELENAIRLQPKNPKYLCDFGVAALRAGWIEKSYAAVQAAVNINPNSARYFSALGDVHLAAQHMPQAVDAYTRAVKLDPENSVYFYNLGLAFMRCNDFKRAAELFSEAIRIKPTSAYHCSRGLAFENLQIHKNAFQDYGLALKLDKNNPYAHYLLAGICSDREDPTYTNKFEAIEHAQKAVKLTDGKNAQYLMGLARAYRVARDYERATASAKLAVELEPSRADLRREYAEIAESKMQGLGKQE